MKIETQILEDHQARLTVEAESQQLESARHKAAQKIAQRVKIPGFRPGKAPYAVVLRTVGEAAILDEAMEILVSDIYPKVIDEAGIKPYGPGNLEKIDKLDPPTLIFVVPLEATVTLGDYRSLRFPYELKTVTEEDVARAIDDLQNRMAILEPANRTAQEGDEVSLRISAERKKVEEGQALTLIRDHSAPVTIKPTDKENSQEWPFPGFSRQLVGLNIGDEKAIEYTYPEDETIAESLRGREAIFRFKVEEIKSRKLPELNDEFAQSLGEFETFEALRTQIRTNLEQQAKADYDETYHNQIIDAIIKDAQIKFPPQMLEHEVDSVVHQLENRLSQQNLDLPTYLKTRKISEEDLHKEMTPVAENRIRRSLVLFEVGKAEAIKVDESELQNETTRTMDTIHRLYSPKEVRRMVTDNFVQNMVSNIAADMVAKGTLERLQAYAKGELTTLAEPEKPSKPASKPKRKKKEVQASAEASTTQPIEQVENKPTAEVESTPKPKRKKKTEPVSST